MKRVRNFTNDHPLVSVLVGLAALWVLAVAMLPDDPPYLDQPHHIKGTT